MQHGGDIYIMEEMIAALLEVLRAQRAASGETTSVNVDDVVEMALNITGRPDEPEEETEMIESLQKTIEELAPDLFPPKTFEEQSDDERAASAASMIEQSLASGRRGQTESVSTPPDPYSIPDYSSSYEEEDAGESDPAALNDLIYKNLMDMMGLQSPQVEYPFDRSQIVYGKEPTFTEQLEEDAREKRRADEEQQRKLSAWEIAQNAIDQDEAEHEKEPYIPQVNTEPETKSASQLAAEAIAQSQERDRVQLEIERQAEALMAQARERGQDPMKFALHQQEILRYMEKNSDELVSFEDYEDLSPEEKMEIERQIQIEKELEAGVAPEDVKGEVPEEFIPEELRGASQPQETQASGNIPQGMTEDMLRELSAQVLMENADMMEEGDANEDIQAAIMENIMKMMSGSGVPVPPENVDDLLAQAADNAAKEPEADTPREPENLSVETKTEEEQEPIRGISAADLAMAAQKASRPQPEEVHETKSAVEIAKEALARELERQKNEPEEEELDLDSLDDDFDDEEEEVTSEEKDASENTPEISEKVQEEPKEESQKETSETAESLADEEDYEYVDPDKRVLGDHTQAEVDEALENLQTLGLEGDVFERAKNMILLELAGSEVELERWLAEQESGKKKKAAVTTLEDEEIPDDLDEDALEMEFESALDDDFEEEFEEEPVEEKEEESPKEDTLAESSSTEETEKSAASVSVEKTEEPAPEEEIKETPKEETTKKAQEDVKQEKSEKIAPEFVEVEVAHTQRRGFAGGRARGKKNVIHRREKKQPEPQPVKVEETIEKQASENKEYQVSIRNSFLLKNSASYMDNLEKYISQTQDRKLTTGFKRLDKMLRYGLHKGSYFIDASPMYLKNIFMQQIADRAAQDGVDVLYISTEMSRYELMIDTISRLSFEMNDFDPDKGVSVMSIMTGEEGAGLAHLQDEMNWYRNKISEHLFILDQEAVDDVAGSMADATPGEILTEIVRSIVRDGAHKPVVVIDNLENIAYAQRAEELAPLMDGMKALAQELGIPIIMSYGYEQESSYEDPYYDPEFHEELGMMCDVYLELGYAQMVTEDGDEITEDDIEEISEDGDSLLVDVQMHRNRRNTHAVCQIMVTPKFNHFSE